MRGRWQRAQDAYAALDDLTSRHRLPDRVIDLLYTALLGFRLRRPTYVEQAGIDARTASRDLKALSDLGLLQPVGETKGRHYVRGDALESTRRTLQASRRPLMDPCPWLPAALLGHAMPLSGRGHGPQSRPE